MRSLLLNSFSLFVVSVACSNALPQNTAPEDGVNEGPTSDAGAPMPDLAEDAGAVEDQPDARSDVAEPAPPDPTRVELAQGVARGTLDDGVVAFLGLPYAAAPTGARRFAPPAPAPGWGDELDATRWPPACTQLDRETREVIGQEDCLYLNVWRPVGAENVPVIVFIHGGGNMFGSTSEQGAGVYTYEGAKLARRTGTVVVTLQYRLSTLGYMSADALDAEFGQTSGNWGLRDQVAALRWVREHIGDLGGDPDRLMLFGESGGASSVCGLVATPEAAGLFGAAVMQSGGCGGKSRAQVRRWSSQVIAGVGCAGSEDTAACLRAADAGTLVRVAGEGGTTNEGLAQTPAGPMIDGAMLPSSPLAMLLSGTHNKVPLVFGVTADETASPLFGIIGRRWTQAQYEQRVRTIFGADADTILQTYSVGAAGAFSLPIQALIALTTDLQFICPSRAYARAAVAGQDAPVYRFLFDHALSEGPARSLGAFHGLELIYNFQHLADLAGYTATADDLLVEDAMGKLWYDFAASGAPQPYEGVTWPEYDPDTDPYLTIATPLSADTGLRTAQCDLLESL